MYTAISGVDARKQILQGRPHGGGAIMYKKSLTKYVAHVKSENRIGVVQLKSQQIIISRVLLSQYIYHVIHKTKNMWILLIILNV